MGILKSWIFSVTFSEKVANNCKAMNPMVILFFGDLNF